MSIESMAGVTTAATDVVATPKTYLAGKPENSLGIVIGTSVRGPAFIPVPFSNNTDFVDLFGKIDAFSFGKLALRNWLNYSNGSYLRLLGIGNGKKRNKTGINAGYITNAGFTVGQKLVATSSGFIAASHRAYFGGPLGRTYFLGCFMSESLGSTIFSDAGLVHPTSATGTPGAIPILRGVLMAPSGVILSLGTKAAANNVPLSQPAMAAYSSTEDAGLSFGDINTKEGTSQEIVLLLNGHKSTDDYKNIISASLDPNATLDSDIGAPYFATAFNTNPALIQEAGHYLHVHYDVPTIWADPTGSLLTSHVDDVNIETSVSGDAVRKFQTVFLLTSSLPRNSGSSTEENYMGTPNFENYQNRFSTPFSPFVTSQDIAGKTQNLFRVHAISNGKPDNYPQHYPTTAEQESEMTAGIDFPLKITICKILPTTEEHRYASFDLIVRKFYSIDEVDTNPAAMIGLETFTNLNLDPGSANFITKRIGDMHTYYNFDKIPSEQRIVKEGKYPNVSQYIRIEVDPIIETKTMGSDVMPTGFRGLNHLVMSGSTVYGPILTGSANVKPGTTVGGLLTYHGVKTDTVSRVSQIPVPMRENIFIVNATSDKQVNSSLTWGVQFTEKSELVNKNQSTRVNKNVRSLVEYFPDFHTNFQNPWVGNNYGKSDINGCILDADRFNNNGFSLEKIEVIYDTLTNLPDSGQWIAAAYRRNGKAVGTMVAADGTSESPSRLLLASDFFQTSGNPITNYLKFTFPLQGGFNGYNIYDSQKASFSDVAVKREVGDTEQGRKNGPTFAAYKKALDVIRDKNYDFTTLAIPGIRTESITNVAVDTAEDRFDMFYVMDIEQYDESGADIQESGNSVHAVNTINAFAERFINSSMAAAYFPDLIVDDASILGAGDELVIPPSVALMGVLSQQDATNGHGTRVTGVKRGNLSPYASATKTIFDPAAEIEKCYLNKINPIESIAAVDFTPGGFAGGPIIQSQVTTLNNESHMSRIDLRRLLIEIRRTARKLALTHLFEQNNKDTRRSYKAALGEALSMYRAAGILTDFSVVLDEADSVNEELQKQSGTDAELGLLRGRVYVVPSSLNAALFIDMSLDI